MRTPLLLGLIFVLAAVQLPAADSPTPPAMSREFRGVWVATVANIDWPSKKGLTVEQQQTEMKAILDKCVDVRLNAVVFQVRPMCDAFYKSDLEPWTEFLTGTAGKAPEPFYDPLEFVVREAHARGLELHAWFNPYRAWMPGAKSEIPANHVLKARPELVKRFNNYGWLNPTHKEVQEHSLKVFLDVVRRYDVDGIHMDDYFYPYPDYLGGQPFPDDDTWGAFLEGGGTSSRDDWRRAAVNSFVERLYKESKAVKPWVKVGISPFGIWRPGNPPGIKGFDQYATLYADARLWLNKGWVDYWTPQLYWAIDKPEQSFPKLLDWWVSENKHHRHIWPGLGTHRHPTAEIVEQIKLTRKIPGPGHVHFSMKHIMRNKDGVADALKSLYAEPALVPASPWLEKPAPPQVERAEKTLTIKVDERVRQVVVRSRSGGKWATKVVAPAAGAKEVSTTLAGEPDLVLVSVVDRAGAESEPAEVGK